MTNESDVRKEEPATVTGYSFPYGVPLIFYPLFFYGAYRGTGHWWGWCFHALLLIAILYFFIMALRRQSYEKIHAQYPDLNRLTWILNYLLFFSLLPLIVWVLVFVVKLI